MQPCASPRIAIILVIFALVLLFVAPTVVQAQTSIYQFDPSNNLLGTITAPGQVTAMTYDSQTNNLVVDSDSHGVYTRDYYDAAGDITQTFTEPGPVTAIAYDAALNEIFTGGGDTLDEYDSFNHLVESIATEGQIGGVFVLSDSADKTETLEITTNQILNLRPSPEEETSFDSITGDVEDPRFTLLEDVTSATYDGIGDNILVGANIAGQNTLTVYSPNGTSLGSVDSTGDISSLTYDPVSNEFGIGMTGVSPGGSGEWLDVSAIPSGPGQSILIPSTLLPPIRFTPGPPTASTWDSENNSFYVAVSPENASIALFAPGLLAMAVACFVSQRKSRKRLEAIHASRPAE